ncbi:hypothetical protein ACJX0J_026624, partial [Zea mays]
RYAYTILLHILTSFSSILSIIFFYIFHLTKHYGVIAFFISAVNEVITSHFEEAAFASEFYNLITVNLINIMSISIMPINLTQAIPYILPLDTNTYIASLGFLVCPCALENGKPICDLILDELECTGFNRRERERERDIRAYSTIIEKELAIFFSLRLFSA